MTLQFAIMTEKRTWEAWLLVLLLSLIWGSSFILIKKSLLVFTAPQVGAGRVAIAFLVLSPLAFAHLRNIPRDKIATLFWAGMLGTFLPAMLFAWAQTSLASAVTGILNALTPIFTLIVGLLFFGLPFKKAQGLGLLMAFLGAISLSFFRADGSFGEFNEYALLVVLATLLYAINVNILGKNLKGIKSVLVSTYALTLVAPFAVGYLAVSDFSTRILTHEGGYEAFGYLSILGVFGTAIGLALFNKLVQITSPVFASVVTYLIPIMAIVWGLLDGEAVSWWQVLAMFFVIGGVFIVNKAK